jgi:GDSL-like lipase/acylhydrolase family protein
MSHRNRLVRALAALAATLAVPVLFTAPSQAAGEAYVALGDSYSSGVGTRTYIGDGTCQRSTYAYPYLVAQQKGYALSFQACGGAKVSDVTGKQLGALTSGTRFVTISIGGNDAGFGDVILECAKPELIADCGSKITAAQSYITNTLPGSLSTLYASIRSKAPSAKVVVVGYPRLFMGEDCNAGTFFSASEMTKLNQTADLLNSKTAAAASAKGFTFVNPTTRFTGHAVCSSTEWINGLSNPTSESYHPNRTGHSSGYLPLVSGVLV